MKRIVVIVAAGLAVAGCASWSMSDLVPGFGPSTADLSLASEPPGAEARTSTGQVCRTPCRLTLPLNSGDFTVTFSLPGRITQVVPVVIRPQDTGAATRFDPNPAYAQLDPIAPPPPVKKKRVSTKPKTAPKAKTGGGSTPAAPPANEPAPAPSAPPGSPWPPPPR